MEIQQKLQLEEFKKKCYKITSPYFQSIFWDYIKRIVIERISEKNGIIIFDIQLDDKCDNALTIAHGGAIATLIENLATLSLFYFNNHRYRTLDINITYKNKVELNQIFQVYVNCERIGSPTTFIEVEVRNENEVCTKASIIKTEIRAKF